MRNCSKCSRSLATDQFYSNGRGGLSAECKSCHNARTKEYKSLRPELSRSYKRKSAKAAHASNRRAVFDAYGWTCICCGERRDVFLTIDHMNNDGAEHKRSIGGAGNFYRWLIANNFPEGFQTMCRNCNWAKAHGGCPHQLEAA